MSMSIDIPTDLRPAIKAAIAKGAYANEQELVSDILRAAMPAPQQYQQLRSDVQASQDLVERGNVRDADFDAVRGQLCNEYDESGKRK